MKKILVLLFVITAFVACTSETKKTVSKVNVSQFSEGLSQPDVQLIDVRTPEEYAEGHIENSTLIDFNSDDFKEQIKDLDPDKPVYLYCRSGNRSGKASKIMKELGFKEIVDLDGGYSAWSEE